MSRAWVVIKRFGRLLKFMLFCIILSLFIFIGWRIFSTGIPKELKNLAPNEKLSEAYSQNGDELYMFSQRYDPITRADRNAGYFAVPKAVFIPDANQAQIVFRYNNSTISSLAKDYELESIPSRDTELFDVTLVLYIDLTPDNSEDNYDVNSENIKTVRVHANKQDSGKSTLYNFYRYVFDFENAEETVNIAELIESKTLIAVHTQIYYKDALDYTQTAYGAICIYDARVENEAIKLSKNDKRIFEKN